jgi:cell wall-associated NlpC family hydrolase
MKPLLASAALSLAFLVVPIPTFSETTIVQMGGVQVIETQADATPNPHPAKRVRARAATTAGAVATRSPDVPALEGLAAPAGGALRGADALIRTALSLVGTPYVWGGADTTGFDCSGFTSYAYGRLGIHIPRTADAQFASGRPIAGDPLPGDLVFFQTYDYGASHVGIYLGNGRFVNSIGPNVHVASFASPYFRSRYLGARRFL